MSTVFATPTPDMGNQQRAENLQRADTTRDLAARTRVAKQFESIFVSTLLKEMRQSTGEEGLFQGDTSDVYGGLFDMFMADHITEGRGSTLR